MVVDLQAGGVTGAALLNFITEKVHFSLFTPETSMQKRIGRIPMSSLEPLAESDHPVAPSRHTELVAMLPSEICWTSCCLQRMHRIQPCLRGERQGDSRARLGRAGLGWAGLGWADWVRVLQMAL